MCVCTKSQTKPTCVIKLQVLTSNMSFGVLLLFLCSPCCPGTHEVTQAGLWLAEISLLCPQELGLQAWAAPPISFVRDPSLTSLAHSVGVPALSCFETGSPWNAQAGFEGLGAQTSLGADI